MSKFKKIMDKLEIDETYTKAPKKYKYDKIKENTFPMQDYNFMIDTMTLPTTKEKYKYLLVVVDLWSDEFDIEPMKTMTSSEALEAFKSIIKRPYLNMPKFSIRSDNGTEFKGSFDSYLKSNKILHRVSLPYRHKQNANVESLNGLIGRILMTYLQNKEMKTKKPYHEWTDIINKIRKPLNDERKNNDGNPFNSDPILYNKLDPKFKIGDIVNVKYEKPHNALGNKESTNKWRKGDTRWNLIEHYAILKVLNYPNNNRYILNGLPNVAYAEAEIKLSERKQEIKEFKKIIGHQSKGRTKYYKVWFTKELKKNAKYYKRSDMLGFIDDEMKEYDKSIKKKKKK